MNYSQTQPLKLTIEWHHVDALMPTRNKFVLVETRYCKYPFTAAYYNGIEWIDADSKSSIDNTRYWTEILTPSEYENISK